MNFTGPHMRLEEGFGRTSARSPQAIAIVESDGRTCSYGELRSRVEALVLILQQSGVRPGDRIAVLMEKSAAAVAAILAVLSNRCCYVPVDTSAPEARVALILNDCKVGAVITDQPPANSLYDQLSFRPLILMYDGARYGTVGAGSPASEPDDDAAYILYTSGSTGVPKGVVHSHSSALAFVDWSSEFLDPTPTDVFSSHAPFHFDLSILDIFVTLAHGARVVLFDSATARDPRRIAQMLAEHRISTWYSTPTTLISLIDHGKMERFEYGNLKTILFAGEVFPSSHLRRLCSLVPGARHVNLYGPTETNVCTFYELPPKADIPDDEIPIGKPCPHMVARVADQKGKTVRDGKEGELLIAGKGVMAGYWNSPELNAGVFVEDQSYRWYRTGDLVRKEADGNLRFLGRRDRLVKRRGFRIELGEIEQMLGSHSLVERCAAIAVPSGDSIRITAFFTLAKGASVTPLQLREYLSERLPPSMLPDGLIPLDRIPKTSNHKTDYQRLKEMA